MKKKLQNYKFIEELIGKELKTTDMIEEIHKMENEMLENFLDDEEIIELFKKNKEKRENKKPKLKATYHRGLTGLYIKWVEDDETE